MATDPTESLDAANWTVVRDAIEEIADRLRSGSLAPAMREQLGLRLASLVGHPKWEVRKSLVEALQHLRHEKFHAVIAQLADDDHAFVCDAARRALARRTELARTSALYRGGMLAQMLDEIGAVHGPRGRAAASRAAEHYAELLFREASHEIVRVIAPVDLALSNLDDELDRDSIDRDAARARIARARDRMRLLGSILDSLRAFTRTVTLTLESESLHAIVDEAVALVTAKRQSAIEVNVTMRAELRIHADRNRLLQAFANVIENAIESYEESAGGTIQISARAEDQHAVVRIVDDGRGMSEEARGDAFLLFATSKPGSAGIGLPLARRIIETEHQGAIDLTTEQGAGTTVTIVLPLHQEQE